MIAWEKITKNECRIITDIVSRYAIQVPHLNYLDTTMDLQACHIYNPLDLHALLIAKDVDFFHDVCGIIRYIDRETGKLTHCFSPRCSKEQ